MPLLVLVVLLAMCSSSWVMVAVFYALGDSPTAAATAIPLNAATLGLLVLGAVKFLPYVGIWAWTAATLIGIGATCKPDVV